MGVENIKSSSLEIHYTIVSEAVRHERRTASGDFKCREVKTESVATLPPFGPIEGQKWFDRISSQ
jgi:hypothetical protein